MRRGAGVVALPSEAMARPQMSGLRRLLRSTLTVLGMLVAYAVMPIPGRRGSAAWDLVLLAVGGAVLAYVVVRLTRQAFRHDDSGVRLEALVATFYAFVVFYSVIYLGIASRSGEFVGMTTRVDSLYFTMTTLTTVGFGDIHTAGQAARVAVTTQLFFDVVFVGLAARLVGPALARSMAARASAADRDRGDGRHGRRDRQS